jgi:hypothetical protein
MKVTRTPGHGLDGVHDRQHTNTLTEAREHLANAEAALRGATLAATTVQEQAAVTARAEMDKARKTLARIRTRPE